MLQTLAGEFRLSKMPPRWDKEGSLWGKLLYFGYWEFRSPCLPSSGFSVSFDKEDQKTRETTEILNTCSSSMRREAWWRIERAKPVCCASLTKRMKPT